MWNRFISTASDLVTTNDQIRAGFLSIALEKNALSDPYVKSAFAFRTMAEGISGPDALLTMPDVRPFVLTAAGVSDKAMQYLTKDDEDAAIRNLIEKFLKPAGENYLDEAVYRYLLIKGDAVGGRMRNRIGAMGQEKLIRTILSCMRVQGIAYEWLRGGGGTRWETGGDQDAGIERSIKMISWKNANGARLLGFNRNIPIVNKNVDLCLFEGEPKEFAGRKFCSPADRTLMLGELKSGFDPAGADEHWKTGNTALNRIRASFAAAGYSVKTSFVGGAIAPAMAQEIFHQLHTGTLTNAANLTNAKQLVEYCNWLLQI